MIDDVDRLFLHRTVELAVRGLYSVAENPRVGCLIVRDGKVIGRGWHRQTGGRHAETHAIADAAGDIAAATVYVSLEPCCHQGRQAPCTDALIAGRAARVVAAMTDPDPRVAGRGFADLRRAGIAVDVAELPAAQSLNAGFVKRVTRGLPLVRVKLAASLDGRTAMASGESQWISGSEARADVQYWRARSSAIVTGIGTVLTDNPSLDVRDSRFCNDGAVRQPLIAIADSHARLPTDAKLLQGGGRVLLFAGCHAPEQHPRAELVRQDGATVDLAAMLKRLAAEGCNEVLVEAGATLAGAFFEQQLWDEAVIYLAPKMLGHSAQPLARLALERLADALTGDIRRIDTVGADARILLQRRNAEHAP